MLSSGSLSWLGDPPKPGGDSLCLSPAPQPVSSSDSEAPEADPAGRSEDEEDRGVMAVTAVTAAATSDRMESDSDSDKSSDNSSLKRKASALKVGWGGAGVPGLWGGWWLNNALTLPPSTLRSKVACCRLTYPP